MRTPQPPACPSSRSRPSGWSPHLLSLLGSERGSSTAEFALTLPAIVSLLALLMGAAACGIAQVKLEEGARLGARAAARGDDAQEISALLAELDYQAQLALVEEGELVRVTLSRPAPGFLGQATGWELEASALAPKETSQTQPESGG